MKKLLLPALLIALAPAPAQAETLQFYCHGNWDNGSDIFASRYFVFTLDTEAQTYIIEGLNEGSFATSKQSYSGIEKDDSGKLLKAFKLERQTLEYEFSYYTAGLATTVGSKGRCEENPS